MFAAVSRGVFAGQPGWSGVERRQAVRQPRPRRRHRGSRPSGDGRGVPRAQGCPRGIRAGPATAWRRNGGRWAHRPGRDFERDGHRTPRIHARSAHAGRRGAHATRRDWPLRRRGGPRRSGRRCTRVIEGKPEVVDTAITVLLAEGHLLVEDVPGVGKTMLAKALARSIDCSVRRVQFTPDLLPSDITGVSVFNQDVRDFEFRPGRDLRQRRRRRRDQPRLAQDPVGPAGVDGGGPGHRRRHDLRPARAVHGDGHPEPDRDGGHLSPAGGPARPVHGADLGGLPLAAGRAADAGHPRRRVPAGAAGTGHRRRHGGQADRGGAHRSSPATPSSSTSSTWSPRPAAQPALRLGASPRATLHLLRASRAHAALAGRDHVLPDDVQAIVVPVLAHRIIPTGETQLARR